MIVFWLRRFFVGVIVFLSLIFDFNLANLSTELSADIPLEIGSLIRHYFCQRMAVRIKPSLRI